jgi:hypothetical protein
MEVQNSDDGMVSKPDMLERRRVRSTATATTRFTHVKANTLNQNNAVVIQIQQRSAQIFWAL